MDPKYRLNGEVHRVVPIRRGEGITLQIDGHVLHASIRWLDANQGELTIDGRSHAIHVAQDDNRLFVHLNGVAWSLEALNDFGDLDDGQGSGGGRLSAPMPGVVVEVAVADGAHVTEGATVLLIESMKMQTEIKATTSGVVAMRVGPGDSFDKGAVLAEIDPAAQSGAE